MYLFMIPSTMPKSKTSFMLPMTFTRFSTPPLILCFQLILSLFIALRNKHQRKSEVWWKITWFVLSIHCEDPYVRGTYIQISCEEWQDHSRTLHLLLKEGTTTWQQRCRSGKIVWESLRVQSCDGSYHVCMQFEVPLICLCRDIQVV